MASVLQVLFSLPAFKQRYFSSPSSDHAESCDAALPAECIECQMRKVADGLLSGRYSHPANYASSPHASPNPEAAQNPAPETLLHASPTPVFQAGVRPAGFKALVGKGHEEFSTMRQQDSEEFLGHLLAVLRRDLKKYGETYGRSGDPTKIFSYALEQRLECGDCKKVRYRTDQQDVVSVAVPAREKGKDAEGKVEWEDVGLWECIEALLGKEALEYGCPSCAKKVVALKYVRFLLRLSKKG